MMTHVAPDAPKKTCLCLSDRVLLQMCKGERQVTFKSHKASKCGEPVRSRILKSVCFYFKTRPDDRHVCFEA